MAVFCLIRYAVAMSDPGPVDHQSKPTSAGHTATNSVQSEVAPASEHVARLLNTALKASPPTESNALIPAVFRGDPVSLPPGCYRTNDLIGKTSINPWSSAALTALLGSHQSNPVRLKSEIVVCPVASPTESTGAAYKFFAVTGFIQMSPAQAERAGEAAARARPRIENIGQKVTKKLSEEASWPAYGQEAEGFWRQRDGRLEWEPQIPEPVPLVAANDVPRLSQTASSWLPTETDKSKPSSALDTGPDHAQAYDAWSASIGGQSAEQWLSFEEWRRRHLADRERAEADRRAEGKSRKQKAKHQAPQQQQHNSTVPFATAVSEGSSLFHPQTETADNHWSRQQSASSSFKRRSSGTTSSPDATQCPEQAVYSAPGDHMAHTSVFPSSTSTDDIRSSVTTSPPSFSQARAAAISLEATHSSSTATSHQVSPALKDPSSFLKTLKHRWNFASMDCAAVIHRTNPSAKFASSILSEKKDRYMLSPCPSTSGGTQKVFVVVELCDEISIDTIVMANHEFFSRMFKRFKVSVAPALKGAESKETEEWKELGIYRARNVRGPQVFNITTPATGFYRYVRIDFLEYYGNEYYCPLSLLRVYGLTQLDHFRRQEEEERRAEETGNLLAISDGEDNENQLEEMEPPSFELPEEMQPAVDSGTWDAIWPETPQFSVGVGVGLSDNTSAAIDPSRAHQELTDDSSPSETSKVSTNFDQPINESSVSKTWVETSDGEPQSSQPTPPHSVPRISFDLDGNSPAVCLATNDSLAELARASDRNAVCSKPTHSALSYGGNASSASRDVPITTQNADFATQTDASSSQVISMSSTPASRRDLPPVSADQMRHSANVQSGNSAGGGSESIYRTITKRLNALEANASLSVQYIEHSGQMLREVFRTMEKRQESRLRDMLRALNSSNWRQIEALKRRQQLDLQRAIFEFDVHRQQTEAERRALLGEVQILASEVMFERRLGIVQLILVLGLFVFMVTTRGPAPTLINAGMSRLAPPPPSRTSFKSFMRQRIQSSEGRSPEGSASEDPDVLHERTRSLSAPLSQSDTTTGSKTIDRFIDVSLAHAHNHPVDTHSREGVEQLVSHIDNDSRGHTTGIPAGDFAEMSPSELRSYLGFDSPRGNRAQSSNGLDASFHDETGDEGLETAIEDVESTVEYDDPDGLDGCPLTSKPDPALLTLLSGEDCSVHAKSKTPTPEVRRTQSPPPRDVQAQEQPNGSFADRASIFRRQALQSYAEVTLHKAVQGNDSPIKTSGMLLDAQPKSPANLSPLRPRSTSNMEVGILTPDSDASDVDSDSTELRALKADDVIIREDSDGRPWKKVISRRLQNASTPSRRLRNKSLLRSSSR